MKSITVVALAMLMTVLAFGAGYGYRSAFAQPIPSAQQAAGKLDPGLNPDTFSRAPLPSRDEFTTQQDLEAFDRANAAAPQLVKPGYSDPGNRLRLHIPIVHIAYRDTIQNLNQKNGLEPHYSQLATLVACRENNEEYDWINHEKQVVKGNLIPSEVIDVVRNKKDTKGLDEKDAVLIQFGREVFHQPKVSLKLFNDMERLFGRRQVLAMTLIMAHYTDNSILYRVYDQRTDPADKRPFPDVLAAEAKQK
jgi:hypothetical protein